MKGEEQEHNQNMLKRQGSLLTKIVRCARYVSSENTSYTDDSVVPIDSKTLFINKTNANILELEKQLFSLEQTEKLTEQISETAAIVRQLAQTTLRIKEKERQHMLFGVLEPTVVRQKGEVLDDLQKKLLPLKNAFKSQAAATTLESEDTMQLSVEPQERKEQLEAKQEVMKSDTEEVPAENIYKVYDLDWKRSDQEENSETQATHTQQKQPDVRQEKMVKEDEGSDIEEEYMLNAQREFDIEGEEPSMEKSAVNIKPFPNKSKTEGELVRPLEDQLEPSVLYAEPEISETMQQAVLKAKVESDMEEGYAAKTDVESDVEEQQSSNKNTAGASKPLYEKYENDPEPVTPFEIEMGRRVRYTKQNQSAPEHQEKLDPELESDMTDIESDVEEQQSWAQNTAAASKPLYEKYENDPEPVTPFEVDMEPRVLYAEQKQSAMRQQEKLNPELESDREGIKTDIESDVEEQQSLVKNTAVASKPLYEKYEHDPEPVTPFEIEMEPRVQYTKQKQSAPEPELESDMEGGYIVKTDFQSDIEEQQSSTENANIATEPLHSKYEKEAEPIVAPAGSIMEPKIRYREERQPALEEEEMLDEDVQEDKIFYRKYDPEAKPIKSLEEEIESEVSYTEQKHSEMDQQQMSNRQLESDTVEEHMFTKEPEFNNEEQKSSTENARVAVKEPQDPLQKRKPSGNNTKKM
uniref:Uncharacterized protein n=1 Tax=Glossina austeni TaxID=7395 RepID=A0A1A9VL37_GLOAU